VHGNEEKNSSVQKKNIRFTRSFGGTDEELIKTNMIISGFVGGEPIPSKGGCFDGVHHQEQNISNCFLSSARSSYLILGRDWIHVNQCVPSGLH
jgi:hypothetical protein